jgi:hypothetical protein
MIAKGGSNGVIRLIRSSEIFLPDRPCLQAPVPTEGGAGGDFTHGSVAHEDDIFTLLGKKWHIFCHFISTILKISL